MIPKSQSKPNAEKTKWAIAHEVVASENCDEQATRIRRLLASLIARSLIQGNKQTKGGSQEPVGGTPTGPVIRPPVADDGKGGDA